jgi:hypothetical protein
MLRPPPAKSSREQCRSRPPLYLTKPVGCFPRLALAQRSAALEPSFGDETGHRQRARQLMQRPSQARERHRKRAGSLGPSNSRRGPGAQLTHTHAHSHNRRPFTATRRRTHADDGAHARAHSALCAHRLPTTNKQTKRAPRCNTTRRARSATGGSGLGSAAAAPRRVATTESLRPRRTSYDQCRPSVNMDTYV